MAEGQEVLDEFRDGEALDAGLIAAAQAIEHYEITRYAPYSPGPSSFASRRRRVFSRRPSSRRRTQKSCCPSWALSREPE